MLHCRQLDWDSVGPGLDDTHDDYVELPTVQFAILTLEFGADRLHAAEVLLLPYLVVQVNHSLADVHSEDGLGVGRDLLRHQAF